MARLLFRISDVPRLLAASIRVSCQCGACDGEPLALGAVIDLDGGVQAPAVVQFNDQWRPCAYRCYLRYGGEVQAYADFLVKQYGRARGDIGELPVPPAVPARNVRVQAEPRLPAPPVRSATPPSRPARDVPAAAPIPPRAPQRPTPVPGVTAAPPRAPKSAGSVQPPRAPNAPRLAPSLPRVAAPASARPSAPVPTQAARPAVSTRSTSDAPLRVPMIAERPAVRARQEIPRDVDPETAELLATGFCSVSPGADGMQSIVVTERPHPSSTSRRWKARVQARAARVREGYRFADADIALGDAFGRRAVVHCFSDGRLTEYQVQADVSGAWFQSPEVPTWKATGAVPDAVPLVAPCKRPTTILDEGATKKLLDAIFDPASDDVVLGLGRKKWSEYARRNGVTESGAEAAYETMIREIASTMDAMAIERGKVLWRMGYPAFLRLWNAALASCTKKETSITTDERAIEAAPVVSTTPVA